MATRAKMTRWYDPPRLISIGIRVAISTVFGEFADRRDAMAASREIDPKTIDPVYDYSASAPTSDFWFDFVADTGDGWDSTYAIARLLADPALSVDGAPDTLPMGQLLIMGGDEVYPTASRENYQAKLVTPYNDALKVKPWGEGVRPDLFAIPGNHDWYDGLSAFIGLFCQRRRETEWAEARQGRIIGGRQTQQTRSYFALSLPHGWWCWAVDIQLDGYIDQSQIDFFEHVARDWMPPESRLILCTGEPEWAYVDVHAPQKTFKNFSYMESLCDLARRKHRLRLVLTGDSHHYSRYLEGNRHYITAGGGGAFLHPTHHLEDKIFDWQYPQPGHPQVPGAMRYKREFKIARDPATKEPRLFPIPATSRSLTWRNLAFAALNWQFAFTLGIACAVFAWLLDTNARIETSSLSEALTRAHTFCSALYEYFNLAIRSPWPSLMFAVVVAGCSYFADFTPWLRRFLVGVLHALAHAGVVIVATIMIAFYAPWAKSDALFILSVGICGGIISATVVGVYLLVCLNWLKKHWDEAFSSLRIKNFKNFLRLRIDESGTLTVYPIGLKFVPRDDARDPNHPSKLYPQLLEAPIQIS
jgi:calcineurin-like phosphoesterase family protein